jgi:excisionase family DNA binding protein
MLSVNEAAIRLGFDERTIRHFLSTGELHGRKMGRQWRISDEEIRRFEDSLKPSQPPEETTSLEAVHPSPEETGQSTSEAQKDHLADIRNVLLDWRRELAPQIEFGDAGSIDTSPSDVEAKLLFPAILEHCSSIRNTHDELVKRRHMYHERWAELESEIRQLAPPEATEGFAKAAVVHSLSVAEGNPVPSYNSPGGDWLEVGRPAIGIARGSAEARKQIEEQHRGLIKRYSEDRRVLEMVNVQKAILEQQHQLANALEGSILRHEHRTPSVRCEFCHVRK